MAADMLTGVPGSGKTRFYKSVVDNDTIIVAPTQELRDQIKNDLKNAFVVTQHQVFAISKVFKKLIIDEAWCFYTVQIAAIHAHIQPDSMLLAGDPNQVPPIDYESDFTDCFKLSDSYEHINNMTTHRCAHDATSLAYGLGYKGMKTTSSVSSSISMLQCTKATAENVIKKLGFPMITFNDSTATEYLTKTIHRSQGSTYPNLVLYVDAKSINTGLLRSVAHIRVALTRHTDNLLILGSADGFVDTLFHVNSKLEVNNARFGQHVSDTDVVC